MTLLEPGQAGHEDVEVATWRAGVALASNFPKAPFGSSIGRLTRKWSRPARNKQKAWAWAAANWCAHDLCLSCGAAWRKGKVDKDKVTDATQVKTELLSAYYAISTGKETAVNVVGILAILGVFGVYLAAQGSTDSTLQILTKVLGVVGIAVAVAALAFTLWATFSKDEGGLGLNEGRSKSSV
jgi:hypothetical protein